MIETKFTPGPWRTMPNKTFEDDIMIEADNWQIAMALADCGDAESQDESEANARLIASGPDLYAMLDEANGAWMVMAEELSLTPEQVARHNALTKRIYKVLETARGEG
jgi:hypothetical protein